VAESLKRGSRVIVTGRLRQRSYETREGDKRTVIELEVDEIGPSLRYATAQVRKLDRATGRAAARPAEDDPWTTTPANPAAPAGGGSDDEPPF
jgi:single-strand DNA-binding protein